MSKTTIIETKMQKLYMEMKYLYNQIKEAPKPNRPEKFNFSEDYSEEKYEDYKLEKDKAYERANNISDLYSSVQEKKNEIDHLYSSLNPFEMIGYRYIKIKASKITIHAYAEASIKFFEDAGVERSIRKILEEYDLDDRTYSRRMYWTTLSRISQIGDTYKNVAGYEKTFANRSMYGYECWS